MTVISVLAWGTICLCLAAACWQDLKTRNVYRFVWWIGGTAAAVLLLGNIPMSILHPAELIVFVLLQHLLFSRYYGRADCRAFCLCAAVQASLGAGLFRFLMHMLFAFLLLAIVQVAKRNVASDGNLSHPVAFLPYITIAFLFTLWYYYT